jgi:type IV secretory pathway ATPase VirB11/archaellum biosynthesis ATPase
MSEPSLSSKSVAEVVAHESISNAAVMDLAFKVAEIERKDLVDILRRVKEHWADGVTPTQETDGDWYGTMREILDEFKD